MYTSNILNGCVIGNRICLTDTSVIWRIFLNITTSTNYYYVYYYFYIYFYYMKTRFPNNSDKVLKLLEVILVIILIVVFTLIIVIITSIITIIIVIISINICTKNFRDVLVILKMKKFWRMIQSLLNNG